MHNALLIDEVLLNILTHLFNGDVHGSCPQTKQFAAKLARTCKAFKEPALNIIWGQLDDLAPLVQCLSPESWRYERSVDNCVYSLKKPLKQTDWDVILGYALRVRALPWLRGTSGLTADCIKTLSDPPTPTGSIFPNLSFVGIDGPAAEITPIVRHLVNSKVRDLSLASTGILGAVIQAFGRECPFVTTFSFEIAADLCTDDKVSDLVCHWQSLRSVACRDAGFNVDALFHLSRLRCLLSLHFYVLHDVVNQIRATQSSTSLFTFSALRNLHLSSRFSTTIDHLIHHCRFPEIHVFTVLLTSRPSLPDLMSLFVAIQEACTVSVLNTLEFSSWHCTGITILDSAPYSITFDHLRPLTAFVNIKTIVLNIQAYGVALNECQLLSLASSWPHLQKFEVGRDYDWAPSSGITPEGFLQLLEMCRSLKTLYFMFDTRNYITVQQGHPWRGLTIPSSEHSFSFHVLNSTIEEASVDALAVFFHVAPHPNFTLMTHWNNRHFRGSARPRELCNLYHSRWEKVEKLARDLWGERLGLRHSLELVRAVDDS